MTRAHLVTRLADAPESRSRGRRVPQMHRQGLVVHADDRYPGAQARAISSRRASSSAVNARSTTSPKCVTGKSLTCCRRWVGLSVLPSNSTYARSWIVANVGVYAVVHALTLGVRTQRIASNASDLRQ